MSFADFQWVISGGLAIVFSVALGFYRIHLNQYSEHKKQNDENRKADQKALQEALKIVSDNRAADQALVRSEVSQLVQWRTDKVNQIEQRRIEDNSTLRGHIEMRYSETSKDSASFKAQVETRLAESAHRNTELWTELKNRTVENQRDSAEFWKQFAIMREKQHQLELQLSSSYHNKAELSEMLNEKINPLLEGMKELRLEVRKSRRSKGDSDAEA